MTTLQELLEQACEQTEGSEDEVSFRNTYSGRGMYGRECVGITGDHSACMKVIAEVIKGLMVDIEDSDGDNPTIVRMSANEYVDTLLGFDRDSMGRDVILYWPELSSIDSADELSDLEDGAESGCVGD